MKHNCELEPFLWQSKVSHKTVSIICWQFPKSSTRTIYCKWVVTSRFKHFLPVGMPCYCFASKFQPIPDSSGRGEVAPKEPSQLLNLDLVPSNTMKGEWILTLIHILLSSFLSSPYQTLKVPWSHPEQDRIYQYPRSSEAYCTSFFNPGWGLPSGEPAYRLSIRNMLPIQSFQSSTLRRIWLIFGLGAFVNGLQ